MNDLPTDKLLTIIERLEAEKAKRDAGNPVEAVPLAVERTFVADSAARFAPPAPVKVEPRPRKAKKPKSQEAPVAPTYFTVTTAKPLNGACGSIEEGWYVVQGGKIFLCDSAGYVTGEGHAIVRSELYTARTALRNRLAARHRPGELDHSPIVYPRTGWR